MLDFGMILWKLLILFILTGMYLGYTQTSNSLAAVSCGVVKFFDNVYADFSAISLWILLGISFHTFQLMRLLSTLFFSSSSKAVCFLSFSCSINL